MTQRFRHLLAGLAAIVAVVTTTLGVAAPAHADPTGSTCMDPTFKGTIGKKNLSTPQGLQYTVVTFNLVGFTTAYCPTAWVDYRYKAAFTYRGDTTSAYHSSIEPAYGPAPSGYGLTRVGTRIEFPEQNLFFQGHGTVNLAVTSGWKSVFTGTWCRSNEETWDYEYYVLPSQVGIIDTSESDGVPRSRINACP